MLVYDALKSDAILGSLSFIVVYLLTYRHLGSLFLTSLGLLQIVGTFPVVFFVYKIIIGNLKFGILNILSIYLVLGIGVDDLFVLVDAFKQEESKSAALGRRRSFTLAQDNSIFRLNQLQKHLQQAYRRAAAVRKKCFLILVLNLFLFFFSFFFFLLFFFFLFFLC